MSQDSPVCVQNVAPLSSRRRYLGCSAFNTNARCNLVIVPVPSRWLGASHMITSPTANGGPGFDLGPGPTSWSSNTWGHPILLGRHVSSDAADVSVSESVSRAGVSSPLSISKSNVQFLSWCGDMSGLDAVISRSRTLRSSPAPTSSPSSGGASSAEVSGVDGPWTTMPSHPALSVETAAPPPPSSPFSSCESTTSPEPPLSSPHSWRKNEVNKSGDGWSTKGSR